MLNIGLLLQVTCDPAELLLEVVIIDFLLDDLGFHL
jgi:hypothetical protein